MAEKFSVLMSVYHGTKAEELSECLNSLREQTLCPNEIVIVCDGPVQSDVKYVLERESGACKCVKIVELEENVGLGLALNAGLKECSYELVARMDTDDVCVPNRFEKQIDYFEQHTDVDVVGGAMSEFTDSPDNPIAVRVVPQNHADIVKYMRKRCPFNHITVMFRKSAVEKVGGYMHWLYNEDYYLWLRMYMGGARFSNIADVLAEARVGEDMYRRRGGLIYFKNEKLLQKFMLKNKIIGRFTYLSNVIKRFILQVLLPNKVREWVFKKFAREKAT